MSSPADELRPFVRALRLGDDGTIGLGEAKVGRIGGPMEEATLAAALTPIVYEHAYARGFPPEPLPAGRAPDLTPMLERANSSRPRTEQGWTATGVAADGSVVATRFGRSRRFAPGQFVAADGVLPVRAGAPIIAHVPAGSRSAQPGFYYCFGEGFREVNDMSPVVRFYWNVTFEGAAPFVTALTALLNRYEAPFELKIATRSSDYNRRDKAVLYVTQDQFPSVATLLAAALPMLSSHLADAVPLFALQLAPGLGFAEDPGNGESFGMARSRLAAAALAAARDGTGFSGALFDERFAAEVRAAGLRDDGLWLNPGSDDVYDFAFGEALAA